MSTASSRPFADNPPSSDIRLAVEATTATRPTFGPDVTLTCEAVERIARKTEQLAFTTRAGEAIESSARTLRAAHERGDEIYGLTTGYGPHVRYAADEDPRLQGAGLIAHLGAGWGALASPLIVRATLAVRCQAIAQGHSGIDPIAAAAFLDLLNHEVCPAIPEIGSVGASGDLIPLAHAARVLTGEGWVLKEDGSRGPATEALAAVGLEPISLTGRDALALVNGTSFMTAYASIAAARSARLLRAAEDLSGWVYRSLGARDQALDARLHEARGHGGQVRSAARIAEDAYSEGEFEDLSRPLQEVYSIRCAPQFLGASRDQIEHAARTIEREINGVNDNPVVCGSAEQPAVLHGGNFQGQQIAFAADTINTAITQIGLLMERQLDAVLSPDLNGGAPLLLAWQPGATSGMAGAQITATAIAAEMRRSATPSSVQTMPTNGRNQDVVSMGTMAARVVYEQTERLAAILAVQAIALEQLNFLRRRDRAPGCEALAPSWLPEIEGFEADRALHDDIQRVSQSILGTPA